MDTSRRARLLLATILATVLGAAAATPASGAELLSETVSVGKAVERSCIERPLAAGPGVALRSVATPAAGWVSARLEAAEGDWDVAIFNATTGRRVAGSSFFGADEVAQSFVTGEEQGLTVQACRRSGGADSATLTVDGRAIDMDRTPPKLSLVKVSTPNRARKNELTDLGLDLTEHGGRGFVEVVLHGVADARKLRGAKFIYTTEIADLAAQSVRDRAADRAAAARASGPGVSASALPSGRTGTYRRLADYNQEMKRLADQNPNLVKPITLPFKTLTGMSVEGIEITTDVNARDGKPVFLQMGAHHAREWPSAEHAMEWAYELVNGFKSGNARVRRLVESSRTIVVPVVNPEGFNTSREAGEMQGGGGGRPGNGTVNFATFPYEYQRKNCRVNNTADDDFSSTADDDPEEGDCTQLPAQGLTQFGADPNRNYGGFWGGPGASTSGPAPFGDFAQDYRGNGPFSERETQNIRALVSSRHVTTLITNHTFSNLILRPPGIAAQGATVDEPLYKALGDAMAGRNGYDSQPSFMLYDTTGGTEDWTYYATGGLGFTFEIGPSEFHPPFAETVAEYDGTTAAAGDGGGNREAYFVAQESTANAERHSVIEGSARPGAVLRLRKSFKTSTSPVIDAEGNEGAPILFDDELNTTTQVPISGSFQWHINPSTRPVVAQGKGRPATGTPSPAVQLKQAAPAPMPPCPTYFPIEGSVGGPATCVAGGFEDVPFDIPGGAGVDNAFATVKMDFPDGADMDLEVYRADGSGNATGEPLAASASQANPEQTTLGPDPAPGRYVARVVNFSGGSTYDLEVSFAGPDPFVAPRTESWTLTCETPGGEVLGRRSVTIGRGARQNQSFDGLCASAQPGFGRFNCFTAAATVRGNRVGRAGLARKRTSVRRTFGARGRYRKWVDRYCLRDGSTMRVAYPTHRERRRLSRSERRRVRGESILVLTTSRSLRLRDVRRGMGVRALHRRIGRRDRVRVGKNVWYFRKGRNSRHVFKVRGGRVREMGIADARLTSSRTRARRFFRQGR